MKVAGLSEYFRVIIVIIATITYICISYAALCGKYYYHPHVIDGTLRLREGDLSSVSQ